ncbi:hypothetical protein HK100_003813 [Physocladia obscura]|uniref:Carrier domain-containing protein n=1 Tax=Physocladia obscura TaxID=109957 RepID=A0AAD5STX6_9FUNG|nr:hypothetical protein HK100_003813 [Physocladia obscura]
MQSLSIQNLTELSNVHQSILSTFGNIVNGYLEQTYELIHNAFENSACTHGDAIAVESVGREISYAELDKRANYLARQLRNLGVTTGVSVVIATGRRIEMMLSMYAVLKSGGTYVPIDPSIPQERINLIVSQSMAVLALVTDDTAHQFENLDQIQVLPVSEILDANISEKESTKLPDIASGDNTAFVVFTSGSTGIPKGVKISHAGVARLFDEPLKMSNVSRGVRMCHFLNVGFDAGQAEVFVCHAGGATLVLRESTDISKTIQSIDILHITPTGLSLLDPIDFPNLKQVFIGSEPVTDALVERWASRVRLINLYGPTETSCFVTGCVLKPGEDVTIGNPLFNTAIYLLDNAKGLVPPGVVGEIYVSGVCVSNGYLNASERGKFMPCMSGNGLMYATGDMGRWLSNGKLQILGRRDEQIKLGGYRVELNEVANTIMSHISVSRAAVVVAENNLIAYVAPKCDESEVRNWLIQKLPQYMIPAIFIFMDELPINVNGKVDRVMLMSLEVPKVEEADVLAMSALQLHLAKIWSTVIGDKGLLIGPKSSFFSIGGNSLAVVKMTALANEQGFKFTVADVFRTPTLEKLADDGSVHSLSSKSLESIAKLSHRPIILCLHGYGTSAEIFDIQMQEIQRALPEVEFLFVNAPYVSQKSDVSQHFQGPYFKWWKSENFLLRHVLSSNKQGVDHVVSKINAINGINGENVVGLLGFSEGAEMKTVDKLRAKNSIKCQWKFSILMSCGKLIPNLFDSIQISTPSLHIFGSDLEKKRSFSIRKSYAGNLEVLGHNKGHLVPRDEKFTTAFVSRIKSLISME